MSLKLGTTNIPGVRVAGSGGQSYTAGTGINITNDVISLDIDAIYPVGSIYIGINNVNPGTIFGGTWEQLEDRFLLGAGSTYTAGATGGEATHTLTINEMPSHDHKLPANPAVGSTTNTNAGRVDPYMTRKQWGTATVSPTGGDQPHNNMPPYLVVYMWKRTA